ncbi:MAG: PadR family transcriptional regulator [Desulfotignum sp.]|nr:PadR family transcriptional regulator [Desulfotignum sp.]
MAINCSDRAPCPPGSGTSASWLHAEGPVVGQWMLKELRHHGYDVSPGTLYPMLHRMERLGWLRSEADASAGPKARRSFYATGQGKEVLAIVLKQMQELKNETQTAV